MPQRAKETVEKKKTDRISQFSSRAERSVMSEVRIIEVNSIEKNTRSIRGSDYASGMRVTVSESNGNK